MIKIRYICYCGFQGYGFAARNYILALHKHGQCDIRLSPLDNLPLMKIVNPRNYSTFFSFSAKNKTHDEIYIFHCIPNMQRREKGQRLKTIGFATFENAIVPPLWKNDLAKNDAIIVPSTFNEKSFGKEFKNVVKIPHCLDFDLYSPNVVKAQSYKAFTFLFIGLWRERKGIKLLLDAWTDSFASNGLLQLLIKTEGVSQAEAYLEKRLKGDWRRKCSNITFIRNHIADEHMPAFIRSADCLVAPSLGEGFGLPSCQAMAVGVPVITTNYSGQQDYANKNTAWLIEPNGFQRIQHMDSYVQFENLEWPIIEVPGIVEQMKMVLDNPEQRRQKAECGYQYIKERFDYDTIGKKFFETIERVFNNTEK